MQNSMVGLCQPVSLLIVTNFKYVSHNVSILLLNVSSVLVNGAAATKPLLGYWLSGAPCSQSY